LRRQEQLPSFFCFFFKKLCLIAVLRKNLHVVSEYTTSKGSDAKTAEKSKQSTTNLQICKILRKNVLVASIQSDNLHLNKVLIFIAKTSIYINIEQHATKTNELWQSFPLISLHKGNAVQSISKQLY